MTTSADGKGYHFPDPIDPEGYRCVKVYIPDHNYYYAAFWGAFEYFTKWVAWKKDAAHNAKDVAAIWLEGFLMSRAAWEAGDCEMAFKLRQSASDPCRLEQSTDGGETWTLAFNYDLCGGPLVSVPPFEASPSGASDAAAAAITNIIQGLVNVAGDCSMTREEYIAAATSYMRVYDAGYSNPAALGGIYDAYCALDPTAQEEAKDDCSYVPMKEELENCYDGDGLIDDLNCLSDNLIDWLNEASEALNYNLILAAMGLSGSGWQAASSNGEAGGGGGAGGGAGFGAECGWCHEFDFTIDDYPSFTHAYIEVQQGHYTAGGYANGVGDYPETIKFRYTFDGIYTIRKMEFEFTSSGGIHHASEHCRSNTQHGTFAGGPFEPDGLDPRMHYVHQGGGIIEKSRDPVNTGYVEIEIWGYSDEFATTHPDIVVTRWKICGEGPDPFA